MRLKIKETYLLLIIVMGLVSLSVYSTYALFTASTTITDVVSFDATLNTDNNLIEYDMVTLASGEVKMVEVNVNNTYSTSLYYGAWYQIVSPSDTTDIVVGLTDDNTNSGSGALAKTSSIKLIVGLANNSSKTAVINIGTVGSTTSNLNLPTGRNLIPEGFDPSTNHKPIDNSGANYPDLVEGLIPVVYNSTTSKWVKADTESSTSTYGWYDYTNKKWANAVLVTETNRNTYQNVSAGTEITDGDILAFYVWIPRYKYKVWNISKQASTESTYVYNAYTEGIDIVFESGTASTGTITCTYNFNVDSANGGIDLSTTTAETCSGSNGDYYTHPAFTFGNTELNGFWMGKFELSSEKPTLGDYGGGNSTTLAVRILPNVKPWLENTLYNYFLVIQNMQETNNIYGLLPNKNIVDSHMIKNMEWGAVAYLTNSNYGRCSGGTCTEVTVNNCSSRVTGIGGDTAGNYSWSSTTCTTDANKYNGEKGVLASTTGNVYGVYDMSGGSYDYVMSDISSTNTDYTFAFLNRDFPANWYDIDDNYKYVDTYAKSATSYVQTTYNVGRLGDATAEIILEINNYGSYNKSGWYSNFANFNNPLKRGGDEVSIANNAVPGIFNSGSNYSTLGDSTTRAILVSLTN